MDKRESVKKMYERILEDNTSTPGPIWQELESLELSAVLVGVGVREDKSDQFINYLNN